MLKTLLPKLTLCILYVLMLVMPVKAQFSLDLETGIVFTGYNDVRIPGDAGTFISFSGELNTDPGPFFRIRAGYTFSERHQLLLLAAPLNISYGGSSDKDIFFQGVTYPAGAALDATYKFNSYRLSYRYKLLNREKLEIGIGATIKARDALIGLKSGELQSEKTDFGFVPLLSFAIHWQAHERIGIILDGDAAAAPQGRAEDVLAAVSFRLTDHLSLKAGYRLLEGGADNRKVYTFSMFHYAVFGGIITF